MSAAPQINRGAKVTHNWSADLTPFGSSRYATQTHAATVVTLDANLGRPNILRQVFWSYSGGTLSGGTLTIEDGSGNTVFSLDITTAGPGEITFDPPLAGSPSTALIITLADGSASVVGKLNVSAWTEQ